MMIMVRGKNEINYGSSGGSVAAFDGGRSSHTFYNKEGARDDLNRHDDVWLLLPLEDGEIKK